MYAFIEVELINDLFGFLSECGSFPCADIIFPDNRSCNVGTLSMPIFKIESQG